MRRVRRNKRRGPDVLMRSKEILIFTSWMLFIIIFTLYSLAKPGDTAMLGKLYNVSANTSWDAEKIYAAFFLTIVLAIICFIGLMVNSKRIKRKGDSYSLSLVIFGIFSLLGVILFPFM